jgi:hypothetical protein
VVTIACRFIMVVVVVIYEKIKKSKKIKKNKAGTWCACYGLGCLG